MTRNFALALAVPAALAVGGCALQAALAAAQLANYIPRPERPSNAHLKPAARAACTARAAPWGSVHIIDVEQRRSDRLVVWGSVIDAKQVRRTFECHFTTAVVGFKLRELGSRS